MGAELTDRQIDEIVAQETGFSSDETTQAMSHEELRRIVKQCILKRVRNLVGAQSKPAASVPAAEPVTTAGLVPVARLVWDCASHEPAIDEWLVDDGAIACDNGASHATLFAALATTAPAAPADTDPTKD